MAQAAGQTLRMFRGNTFVFQVTLLQGLTAFNLTSCTMTMTAKYNMDDAQADAVFTCTVGGGIALTTPSSGIFTVTVAASKTADLPNKEIPLFYDIELTDTTGAIYTVLSGKLIVRPTVTTDA